MPSCSYVSATFLIAMIKAAVRMLSLGTRDVVDFANFPVGASPSSLPGRN